ncbi:MAG: hypothetical protein ACJAZO_001298 [Myxococcota bacterium]|jgi:hypothetical protein
MPTNKQEVIDVLAARHPTDLRAILEFARVPVGTAQTPRELAARIASQLWWTYATPLGLAVRTITLDEIANHTAKRLRVDGALPSDTSAWERLTAMSELLVPESGRASLESLDKATRDRLVRSWWPTLGLAAGAGGGFGALGAGRSVLWLAGTRVGRVLPYLPNVGSWVGRAYKAGGVAAALGGPVGIALSLLTANDALGTNYPRLIPLLLGVGALGPVHVEDAVEVETAPPQASQVR